MNYFKMEILTKFDIPEDIASYSDPELYRYLSQNICKFEELGKFLVNETNKFENFICFIKQKEKDYTKIGNEIKSIFN